MTCEMVHVSPTEDGSIDHPCTALAVGVTEGNVSVCHDCAIGMVKEGFRVDWNVEAHNAYWVAQWEAVLGPSSLLCKHLGEVMAEQERMLGSPTTQ